MFRHLAPVILLLSSTIAVAADQHKLTSRERNTTEGYRLIEGPQFSIQVKLIETRNYGGKVPSLYIYDYVLTDNSTGKIHGGRSKNRLEAGVSDMDKPARWQFKDLNSDGHIDYRYYKGDGKKNDFWWAEVWQPKGKRFLFAKEFAGKS